MEWFRDNGGFRKYLGDYYVLVFLTEQVKEIHRN